MTYCMYTLPETNIFQPENWWLEYDRCFLGFGLFSVAFAVSFREGKCQGSRPGQEVKHFSKRQRDAEIYTVYTYGSLVVVTLCVAGSKGRTRSSGGGAVYWSHGLLLVMFLRGVVLCCVWYICCLRYMFVFGFGLFCVLYAVFIFLCNFKHAASLEKVELRPLPHSALPSPWGESHKPKNRPTNRTVSMTARSEAWQKRSETIKNIWSST